MNINDIRNIHKLTRDRLTKRQYFNSREELDKYLTKCPEEKILKIGYEQGINTNGKEHWFVEENLNG